MVRTSYRHTSAIGGASLVAGCAVLLTLQPGGDWLGRRPGRC